MEPLDKEQHAIEAMKAADDFAGLGRKVQELFKLPQSLCKVRGNCCRVATFKGTLSYEELVTLAQSQEENADRAREFLTLFEPYTSRDEVLAIAPGFVERVEAASDTKHPEKITYFKCRFLGDNGACRIHEDRPTGCRVYPFPHEKTIYHPGCGFEEKGVDHWRKILDITQFLEKRRDELTRQANTLDMGPPGSV